jgi:hypothetical protein
LLALVTPSLFWPTLASAQFTATRLSENPSFASAIKDGVMGGVLFESAAIQPVLWTAPGLPPLSLGFNPNAGGRVLAMNSTHQFGEWGGHAAMWSGTASSYVNLNPGSAVNSEIRAASSTQQAGWTKAPGQDRWTATLWSGSAASAVGLAPTGSLGSKALAMTETHQGGFAVYAGQPGQGSIGHAALWSGSAASFVDLNPAGHVGSGITGMFDDQQVGSAQAAAPGSAGRAAMWFGSPESFRTMHPFPTGLSEILGTCGTAQVGYMNSVSFGPGAGIRAAIWFGTAESVFDLSQFLPAGYGQSIATCIEERNGVFTVGGYVQYGSTDQAFVWVGVPTPSTTMAIIAAGILAVRRRRTPRPLSSRSCYAAIR